MTSINDNTDNINNTEGVRTEGVNTEDVKAETQQDAAAARDNLREAGDALLAAGSAIGAALGKFAGELPERFKAASDSARETLNAASTEGEVRSVATNWANEAEKVFNSLRERDLKFTDDAKATLRNTVNDVRASFNERVDNTDTSGVENAVSEIRDRFESLVERVQAQFSGDDAATGAAAGTETDTTTTTTGKHAKATDADVIDGEVVE